MVTIKASTIDSVNNFTLDGKEYLKKDYKTYYEDFETSQTGSIQVLTYIGIVGSNSNIAPLVYVQSPKRYSSNGVTGFADYATASTYLEDILAEPAGTGTGASSFSGLTGSIGDGQVPESAVKQWEDSLEIDASQVDNLPSGGASTADAVSTSGTPTNFTNASNDVQGAIDGIDTALGLIEGGSVDLEFEDFVSPDLYPQDDALSESDVNDISAWSGTPVIETTIVRNGSYSIKIDPDGSTGNTSQRTITGLSPSTTYRITASSYTGGYAQAFVRVVSEQYSAYTGKFAAQSTTGAWLDGFIDVTTGASETSILLELALNNTAASQFGYFDGITIKEIITLNDYETFSKSLSVINNEDIEINSRNVYFDDEISDLGTNNIQKAIEKSHIFSSNLFKRGQYDYVFSIDNGVIIAQSNNTQYPDLENTDLSDILDEIQLTRIDPFKSTSGRFLTSMYFKKGTYNMSRGVEFSGGYPTNTEATQLSIVMEGEDAHSTIFKINIVDTGDDTFTFTDGLRIRLENFTVQSSGGNGKAIYAKAPSQTGGFSIRDSYINRVYTYHSTTETSIVLENFFSVICPYIRTYNFLGGGIFLKNNSTTTNYGNSAFGKVNVSSSPDAAFTGFKVGREDGTQKIMNLITVDYLELGTTAGEGGGAASQGIHFDYGSNITIGLIVSEYLGRNVHMNNSSNITIMNGIFTIERASDQVANEAYGYFIDNCSNVKIFNGNYYTTDYTAAPLIVNNVTGKGGNFIQGQLVNNFPTSLIQRTGDELTEIHFHQDGSTDRLDVYPFNKYHNNIGVDGSTLGAPFTSDTTLAQALATAAANGTGTGSTKLIGSTAQRPASPSIADDYYDTDLGYNITFNGTVWADALGQTV